MVADALFSREAPDSMHGQAPDRVTYPCSVLGAAAAAECAGDCWLATVVAEATGRRGLDGLRLLLLSNVLRGLLNVLLLLSNVLRGLLNVLHVSVLLLLHAGLLHLHVYHRHSELILTIICTMTAAQ